MAPSLLFSPAPYHILAFVSKLLDKTWEGANRQQIRHIPWHNLLSCEQDTHASPPAVCRRPSNQPLKSFINGIVAIRTLPRAQFALLQSKLFPIYFSMQTAIPIVLALTYPLNKTAIGGRSGVAGVLAPSNRWAVLAPIALMFLAGLANLVVVGPATARCMRDRKSQGESSRQPLYFVYSTRSREEGWEEKLRSSTTFAGDGSAAQEVRHASWHFVSTQSQRFHWVCHIRHHPVGSNPVISISLRRAVFIMRYGVASIIVVPDVWHNFGNNNLYVQISYPMERQIAGTFAPA